MTSDVHDSQPYSSRDVNPAVVTDFVSLLYLQEIAGTAFK